MLKKREHGKRNKKLSKQLFDGGIYLDWTITTAFYSAIHLIEAKVLPCTIRGQQCANINDVMDAYRMRGRHASRERLAQDFLPMEVYVRYKWLDDKSRYSRYTTYKITKTEAVKACEYINYIEDACK
ncbi:MAG: hypothetical protein AAF620_19950 [Bacteroidota bacterium]